MSKFDFAKQAVPLMNNAQAIIKKEITEKIRIEYPDITDFSVTFDSDNQQMIITGLTADQAASIIKQ